MASDEEQSDLEEEQNETEEIQDCPLTAEVIGENLSLLCKTGNGLAHAYVRLDIKSKKLTDISILNCYVHLRYLDISSNKLSDISAINALPNLLSLKADHNLLISAHLEEFPYLQVADFSDNKITSTEGIAHPLLEKLLLATNKITEVSGLTRQNLPSLRVLDLHSNKLSSTDNISIPTLRQLFLASNNITVVECLDSIPQLTILHLRENQIIKLDGFTDQLESLQYINLRGNQVADMSEIDKLKCLPMLRALSLTDCPLEDIDEFRVEVLVRLRQLEKLDKDQFTDDERTDAEEVHSQRQVNTQEEAEQQ